MKKYLVEFIENHYGTGGSFKKGDIVEIDDALANFLADLGKIIVVKSV